MLLIFGTKLDDSGISENHQFRLHYQKQRYLIIHFAYFFIEIEKQLVFGTTLDLTGGKGWRETYRVLGNIFLAGFSSVLKTSRWFRMVSQQKWVVLGGFGSFLVVLGDFNSFRGVTCFVLYHLNQNIEKTSKVREKK